MLNDATLLLERTIICIWEVRTLRRIETIERNNLHSEITTIIDDISEIFVKIDSEFYLSSRLEIQLAHFLAVIWEFTNLICTQANAWLVYRDYLCSIVLIESVKLKTQLRRELNFIGNLGN